MSGADLAPIATRVARSTGAGNHYFGRSVADDLAGAVPLSGLLALSISGRLLPDEGCRVLDDIAASMMAADPRIWPLKLARVASSYGDTLPAVAAATLWMEEGFVGFWSAGRVAAQLVAWRAAVDARQEDPAALEDAVLSTLSQDPKAPGFGPPLRERDERLPTLEACLRRRGDRTRLPFWRLLQAAGDVAARARGLSLHVSAGVAAACLDLGFTPAEIAPLAQSLVHTAILANAVEGARQAPAVLQRLPDSAVQYVGRAPRQTPRASGDAG